jgi:DNA recombination protein RmuC
MTVLEIILLIVAIVAVIAGTVAAILVRSNYKVKLTAAEADAKTSEALRLHEKELHEQTVRDLKESNERSIKDLKDNQSKVIEAVKNELKLESEKALKEREASLKAEAEETIKALTGGLNKDIKDMREAFDAQKKAHAEESSAIKTKFDETVRNLRQQTDSIGTKADNLASALKGKNKMQGIFGETILENILKAEGLRLGKDYDAEFYLRDRKGNIIVNEETQRRMRPDFALHFPDNTDILIDSKVSLSALADYFDATTDEERADAAARNLESVLSHVKELTGKEYQKFVQGRKTLDYVIMFIPNYGAYQLAKQEDKDIFAKAFAQNVLITTEETLIPFLRLIRSAWVQKEQMDNMQEIVDDAQKMIDRIALFFDDNAKLQKNLEDVLEGFKKNTERLTTGKQSVLKAAHEVVQHGVAPTKRELPPITEEQ